jgi:hypothetical protein
MHLLIVEDEAGIIQFLQARRRVHREQRCWIVFAFEKIKRKISLTFLLDWMLQK